MQPEMPKAVKKTMRMLADLAHENELKQALDELHKSFGEWKSGRIDSFELSDRIHKFHNGTNREIYVRYVAVRDPRLVVSRALHEGLLQMRAIPDEVRPFLFDFPVERDGRE